MSPNRGNNMEQRQAPHQRAPDPAEEADKPLEPKSPADGARPNEGATPYSRLNNPVGEPDPTADSDPYEPNRDLSDPVPPGEFPGPGPEPGETTSGDV